MLSLNNISHHSSSKAVPGANMSKLEELRINASVQGILPNSLVSVVSIQGSGGQGREPVGIIFCATRNGIRVSAMSFWNGVAAGARNLRLFELGTGWRQHGDEMDADGRVTFVGCSRALDETLSIALNASNLLLLTGAGSSFCIGNPPGKMSAPSMSDLWDAVEAAASQRVMAEVIALIPNAAGINKNIEKLLTLCKLFIALYNNAESEKVGLFIKSAEKAILARVDFVDKDTNISSHRSLVRKVARRGSRKPRTKIFTTNYDLCFEQAARQQQFVVIDGFSHSTPQVYDRAHFSYDIVRRDNRADAPDYVENVFHLYKLHGSLDWRRSGMTILRSRDAADGDPVLIYPRDTKFQEAFEAPYLDMMGALQAALREPDTALIVSGFGFNDDHISKPVMAAVEANLSLRVIVCDVAFLSDASLNGNPSVVDQAAAMRGDNAYLKQWRDLANNGDKRITLINGRFEDLADAIPDLVAQTERERHADRMHRVRDSTEERNTRGPA